MIIGTILASHQLDELDIVKTVPVRAEAKPTYSRMYNPY